ncbi:TRAP transporter substrate-binding protein [Shimia abyssi]|uniref:TRAP-type C4-dicarboxylate transport system substrate-binding protein n=1 Tax=Shimia abyssi TaxID=1662395 RepID=A0A2P8FDD5_9RHOB|nr:TRAP transporter substrate-binding protein [Shimia abyssi]PSL19736.1 TRAP-type C4-dicarboxylate transport system substrate-binding protein [Shimia abyssi]
MTFSTFKFATAFASVFSLTGLSAYAEELSVATFVPPSHETVTKALAWFESELTERSNGEITIKLYAAGQLGAGPVQQYKRAVEGVADITFGIASTTPTLFPKTMLAILPGKAVDGPDSTERMWRVFDEYMADEWSDVKVLGIANPAGGMIIANRDVSTIEGMKGAKIVPWASMTTPVMKGMGAVPVQMDPTEHYTALSTGTIDGAISSINNIMPPWNLDEVAEYAVVNTPATFNPVFYVMNKERYESLSAEHQAIIDEISGLPFSRELARAFHEADLEALEWKDEKIAAGELNVKWIVASPEERAKMEAAAAVGMAEIYEDYAARGIPNAQEIYEALNQ